MSTPKLTLEAFAEFCASKPADEAYNYMSVTNCAGAQYAKHLGMFDQWIGPRVSPFWDEADYFACVAIPRTFGGLSAFLRSALSRTEVAR